MKSIGKYFGKLVFLILFVLYFPTSLLCQTTNDVFQESLTILICFGAFYGILFFMLIISFLRFFHFRDKAYLCYGLYIFFNLIFFIFWYGLNNPLFSFSFAEQFPFLTQTIFQTALFLSYSIYYFFIINFFKLWSKNQEVASLLQRLGFIYLSLIVFDLVALSLLSTQILTTESYINLRTIVLILALIIGISGFYYAIKIKDKLIGIILTGTLLYFIGSTIGFIFEDLLSNENKSDLLAVYPLIPTQVGFLLEVLCFSFGLTFRISQLEKDNTTTTNRLIQQLTANQQLELEKVEAQRLTEINELKTKLYTNITHEFKTPLTIIDGIANSFSDGENKALIQRNSTYLLDLVNRMLDLEKFDTGELSPQFIQADIIIYLQYLADSHISLATSQKKTLSFYSEAEELKMDYDPRMIRQIISNLISNSLKFTKTYGKIQFTAKTHEGYLILQIKDSGIGIAPEQIPHIFDRFYQVDNKKANNGSGLGLALVKNLVEILKGDIKVESTLGKNTIFKIKLPITNAAAIQQIETSTLSPDQAIPVQDAKQLVSPNQLSSPLQQPLIIIMEDNEDMATYLELVFKSQFNTLTVRNGKEGIQKVKNHLPDAVICDIMMPQMDGFQVCNAIRSDLEICHIPIILLSAKDELDSRLAGLKAGADVYIQKPFDREELLLRVQLLVKYRRLLKQFYTKNTGILAEQSKEDLFLKNFFGIIENHYQDPDFALPQLCQKIHLERTQVYRKIKRMTDKAPSQLIKSFRLKKAKELSLETNLTDEQIAQKIGYRNTSYFLKNFEEEFGHSIDATHKYL